MQKKAGLLHAKWNELGMNVLKSSLKDQKKAHCGAKENGKKHHKTCMHHVKAKCSYTGDKGKVCAVHPIATADLLGPFGC